MFVQQRLDKIKLYLRLTMTPVAKLVNDVVPEKNVTTTLWSVEQPIMEIIVLTKDKSGSWVVVVQRRQQIRPLKVLFVEAIRV